MTQKSPAVVGRHGPGSSRPAPHLNVVVNVGRELASSRLQAADSDDTHVLLAKRDVNYRRGMGGQTCSTCAHWTPSPGPVTGECDLVAGKVQAAMVCDRWEHPNVQKGT